MNIEYPMWSHVKQVSTSKSSKNTDLLFIGDSRAKAGFIPKIFDTKKITSYNLSIGGATSIEGYYTLKRYLKNHKTPKYLILSYSPYHLTESDTYIYRTIKFDFLNIAAYYEVEQVGASLDYINTLKMRSFTKYLFNPFFYLPEFKSGIRSNRRRMNEVTLKKLYEEKGHYYFGRSSKAEGKNRETSYQNFKNSKLLQKYLVMLIKLAQKSKIRVYWYTMPMNSNSYLALDSRYIAQYNNYISCLSREHNITVLNKLYYLENSSFGDRSHLFKGSKKVTLDIREKLLN